MCAVPICSLCITIEKPGFLGTFSSTAAKSGEESTVRVSHMDSLPDLKGSPPMARCGHYIISAMCSKRHRKAVKQQIRRVCLLSFCRCHSAIFFGRFFGGSTFACANCAFQWLSLFGQTENRKKLGSSHDQKKMRLEIFISKII